MMIVQSLVRDEIVGEIKYSYFYRLVKSQVSLETSMDMVTVQGYGIEIERQDTAEDCIINIERDCIKNISPHRYKVHNLMKKLYELGVSPVHLVEVIGDCIDEYIIDFDEALNGIATN